MPFCCGAFGRFWQIVLQKSKVAGLRIFRENTKLEATADFASSIALPKSPVSLT